MTTNYIKNIKLGTTLVEVVVAAAIMAIVAVGMGSALLASGSLRVATSEQTHAGNLLRQRMEMIMATHRETTGTNQNGLDLMVDSHTQAAPEAVTFGDGTQGTLTITFYLNEQFVPTELGAPATVQNAPGEFFGVLDLNGDGDTDDNHTIPAANTYTANLIPVEVNVTWGNNNNMKERRFMLVARVDND